MLKFIIRRLLQLVVVFFVLSVLLFAWLRALPGGVVSAMPELGHAPADENEDETPGPDGAPKPADDVLAFAY